MPDLFENLATSLESPAAGGFSITPNDSADLPTVTRALYVGTGGTLAVTLRSGQTVTFQNLPNGALLPIRVLRVLTGTTAGALVGLY
jgi:hypothetical protein